MDYLTVFFALAGLIIQGLMFRWSWERPNRRMALRLLHVLLGCSWALLLCQSFLR